MNAPTHTRSGARFAAFAIAGATLSWLVSAQEIAPVNDSAIRSFFVIDQLEYASNSAGSRKAPNTLYFNTTGWVGGDYNRIWVNTEGTKPDNGRLQDFDVQLLYGRLISPFWDVQAGIRYFDAGAGTPARGYGILGLQGLAPYRFEVQTAAFVSDHGDVSGRFELEYDLLLTQRWVLQPRFETNVALQKVKEQRIGSSINDVELGVRLRYEIRREFAPYVGVSWQDRYGGTAQFLRERGEAVGEWRLVAGLRLWF